jgi:predicted transcriptional regulator of viral defense system
MSLSSQVKNKLNRFRNGQVFSFSDFEDLGNFEAVANALSRLKKAGVINRLSKGKYFVPQKTRFGTLGPSENQILESYLKTQGGYITGQATLNTLGLSTQVPNEIVIGGVRSSRTQKIGALNLRFQKGPQFKVKKEEMGLVQILEALKNIKNVSDGNLEESIEIMKNKIKGLNRIERIKLVKLAPNYRPSVKALLGAILEEWDRKLVKVLKMSLNPFSTYDLGAISNLPNKKAWNIK